MRAHELLEPGALADIEAAIGLAERATSGEIVPVVVERSDTYADVRLLWAALLALAAGGGWLFVVPALADWALATQICVFAAVSWIASWRPLLRLLAPNAVLGERVHRAAALAFQEGGLVETRDRTGILIYVSLLERRVVVLADRGIHARVADGTWDGVVARVLDGIRAGRADEGLVDGIRLCGEILASRFPRRADDVNELADRPRGA